MNQRNSWYSESEDVGAQKTFYHGKGNPRNHGHYKEDFFYDDYYSDDYYSEHANYYPSVTYYDQN